MENKGKRRKKQFPHKFWIVSLSLYTREYATGRDTRAFRDRRKSASTRGRRFSCVFLSREKYRTETERKAFGDRFFPSVDNEFEHTRAEIFEDKHTPRCLFSAIETNARERVERERRRRCFCLAEEPSFGAKNERERDILEGKFSRSTIPLSGEIRRKGRSVREGRSSK